MTPPPHLLPLALEAMHSADACEVLGDALMESGWCDWRLGYVASGHSEPPDDTPWWMQNCARWVLHWLNLYPREADSLRRARAIAAVLLFGEWSTERWSLVEAHEARQRAWWYGDETVTRPGILFGINREEPPTRLAGSGPPLSGLGAVWAQELDGAMQRYSRDLSYALTARMYAPTGATIQHPDDEEDDDGGMG